MANTINPNDRWYFTKDQLDGTPSRKCGYDSYKELSYRQQTANFIQDMGQRLKVSQLCINTAIVYMHRFYVFHSFTNFPWHQMAAAALFLAAKVEEQPRKLEYVIRVANMCRNSKDANIDVNSERYLAQSQDLVFNENVLLQTLGFDVAIDHPHTHVVRCCHLVKASKDLAQSSYFLASNSLHLTTMCLQYKPTVVACFCIHLACKWSSWEIPLSKEKKEWFLYVDLTVTAELLQQLTEEFLSIFESCPSRLKEKIMAIGDIGMHNAPNIIINSPFDTDPKKILPPEVKDTHSHRSSHDGKSGEELHKHRSRPHDSNQQHKEREYREKRDREKMAAQHGLKPPTSSQSQSATKPVAHGHHRSSAAPIDPKLKGHLRPPSTASTGGHSATNRNEPRDILREASRDSPFGIAPKEFRDVPAHADKDTKSREFLTKNSGGNSETSFYGFNGDKRSDPNRMTARSTDTNKISMKHEQARRHDDTKTGFVVKAPMSDDATNSMNKRHNSTINNKVERKLPFEHVKSVPRPQPVPPQSNRHHHNGSGHQTSHDPSLYLSSVMSCQPDGAVKNDIGSNARIEEMMKKPSLFSPDKSPEKMGGSTSPMAVRRVRNASTGSEPELRPVMKKIDQIEGFENLMRDASIGINQHHLVPDIITPIADKIKSEEMAMVPTYSKEMRPPDIIPPLCSDSSGASGSMTMVSTSLVNGRETDPALISSLLKEAPTVPHLLVTGGTSVLTNNDNNHHHHKSKKKNKEKHKHKDKSRDDKEKKKKHKDKDREKHKHKDRESESGGGGSSSHTAEPIKIKIHKVKDKMQSVPPSPIRIKIPKDVIKSEETQPPIMNLKIKIPKEAIGHCATETSLANNLSSMSRKRERDRVSPADGGPPPIKLSRSGGGHSSGKQNGRHSNTTVMSSTNYTNANKVTQLGDGDASVHRLAESKYNNKNSS